MSETPKTKKIPDLDKHEGMVLTTVLLPQKHYKRLGELAEEKETSKASIVRHALKKHFDEQDKIMETPKTSETWTCKDCEIENPSDAEECQECGELREEIEEGKEEEGW